MVRRKTFSLRLAALISFPIRKLYSAIVTELVGVYLYLFLRLSIERLGSCNGLLPCTAPAWLSFLVKLPEIVAHRLFFCSFLVSNSAYSFQAADDDLLEIKCQLESQTAWRKVYVPPTSTYEHFLTLASEEFGFAVVVYEYKDLQGDTIDHDPDRPIVGWGRLLKFLQKQTEAGQYAELKVWVRAGRRKSVESPVPLLKRGSNAYVLNRTFPACLAHLHHLCNHPRHQQILSYFVDAIVLTSGSIEK